MKRLLTLILVIALALPAALAVDVGTGIGVDITPEEFEPLIWMCDHRIVTDDNVEWGRVSNPGDRLIERQNNYAFEGEQISWLVLVMDKNGIEKIEDVFGTLGDTQGAGNDIEVNCDESSYNRIKESCNARILEEELTEFDADTMRYYDCTLTVETVESMYGEYWVTIEVTDLDGLSGTMDENEYWFFNPTIALAIDGELVFEDVRPGTVSYSETLLVGNDADDGSGVLLDMFIAGTDFYDSASSGAKCPTTNQLQLNGPGSDGKVGTDDDTGFRYFATSGAYSTQFDQEDDAGLFDPFTPRDVDAEGYVNIQYGDHFDKSAYYEAEIMQPQVQPMPPYYGGNVLAPGAEMAITFKLSLPEPCNGNFDTGSLYFFGEAV